MPREGDDVKPAEAVIIEAFTELRIGGDGDVGEILDLIMEVQEAFTTAADPDVLLRLRV